MARLGAFLQHQWQAQGPMLLHSPFVYDFYRAVYRGRRSAQGARVARLRRQLSQDQRLLQRTDLGAGGQGQISLAKTVQQAGRRRIEGEWLYRLCRHYQPRQLLELGTHVGLSALYQAGGLKAPYTFYSLEGDPALASLAARHFEAEQLPIQIIEGDFTQSLQAPPLIGYRPDYVLIDGNHRGEATLQYFEMLLPRIQAGGMMVFDDIRWSAEMTNAWQAIKRHPEVSVSIDLFTMGICFLRRPQVKEHFSFRYRL